MHVDHTATARSFHASATRATPAAVAKATARAMERVRSPIDQKPAAEFLAPRGVAPGQWEQSVGLARVICARTFRDGGTPDAAVASAGLNTDAVDWDTAIRQLAQHFCR